MKTQKLFLTFLSIFSFSIHLLAQAYPPRILNPWERVTGIEANVQGVTYKNGTLFAFTENTIYQSTDYGDTWLVAEEAHRGHGKLLACRDSLAIIKWKNVIQSGSEGNKLYGTVVFYDGVTPFRVEEERITSNDGAYPRITSTVKEKPIFLFSDGEVGYVTHRYRDGWNYHLHNGDIRWGYPEGNWHSAQADTTYWMDEIHNWIHEGGWYNKILGRWNNQFINLTDDLKFRGQDVPVPDGFQMIGAELGVSDSVFIVSSSGIMMKSFDGGETWENQTIPSGGISYQMENGLHVLETTSGYFLSQNGMNFTPLPAIFSNDNRKKQFWIFDQLVIANDYGGWYRSFDKGVTWTAFFPKGMLAEKIDNMLCYNDTVYVETGGKLFRHICNSEFEQVVEGKDFLRGLHNDAIVLTDSIFTPVFGGIRRYIPENNHWDTVTIESCREILRFYYDEYRRQMFVFDKFHQLFKSTDFGVNWTKMFLPKSTKKFEVIGDSVLIEVKGSSDADGDLYLLSSDNGLNWEYFDWSGKQFLRGNTKIFGFGNWYLREYDTSIEQFDKTWELHPSSSTVVDYSKHYLAAYTSFYWVDDYSDLVLIDKETEEPFVFDKTPTFRLTAPPDWVNPAEYDSIAVRGIDNLEEDPKTRTVFISSKINGLWRMSANPTDRNYQESITRTYNNCGGEDIEIDGVTYPGEGRFIKKKTSICEPDTTIVVIPGIDSTIYASKCSSEDVNVLGGDYWWPATYYRTLVDSTGGCDTVVKIVIENDFDIQDMQFNSTYIDTLCDGDTIMYEGEERVLPFLVSEEIIYSETGCDSIRNRMSYRGNNDPHKLFVLPVLYGCEHEVFIVGDLELHNSYSEDRGMYLIDTFTQNGCPVTMRQPVIFSQERSESIQKYAFLCEGDSLLIGNTVITETGYYQHLETVYNELGCDSLIFDYRVTSAVHNDIDITTTNGDIVDGVVVHHDTIFTHSIISELYGCDSIVNHYNVLVPVGIPENLEFAVKIYPNPTRDHIFVEGIQPFDRMIVTDVVGRKLVDEPIPGNITSIDVHAFPSGSFYVLLFKDGVYLNKMIFEKVR